ncbi:hypothetical protein ACLKA7_014580 [Drosophila subpalustris]
MHALQLLICLAVVCVQGGGIQGPEARSATPIGGENRGAASAGILDSVLRGNGKSRQSRCVRCYEDRYYPSTGRDRYSGYSSRSAEDPRSSWYYSYDRYEDRGSIGRDRDRDRDYDRYYSRDDRYSPRTYDRYEGRGGYDDYRRGSTYGDRGGSSYGYSGYSAYDSRDRYYGDRYSDSSRDRYYDRSRTGYNYDKYDPYDRYYSRGQSGFDNSGRGYYFAGDDDDSRRPSSHPLYDRERASSASSPAAPASPCGQLISNCPYADRGTKISSSAIGSDGYRGGHTSVMGDMGSKSASGPGSWTYLGEQDSNKQSGGNTSGASNTSGAGGGRNGDRDRERDRERDAQSSSYGGRPRPLGGSYLFDRDSNAVPEGASDAANSTGDGPGNGNANGNGNGSHKMPAAAAQTAPAPNNESQLNDKDTAKSMQ